jgi:signal transduction histidine kinase
MAKFSDPRNADLTPERRLAPLHLKALLANRALRPQSRRPPPLILVPMFTAIYFVLARLGLSLATVGQSITLVWPPTGISLVALLLFGYRLWPGVALGALLVNALTPRLPFLTACGIAAGNTLEALVATYLLRRTGFRVSLERVRDVVLLLLAAGLSSAIGATFGVASLWSGGVLASSQLGAAWSVWWLGDLMGDVSVAPLLLRIVARVRQRRQPGHALEALAVCAALTIVSLVAFGFIPLPTSRLVHPYLVFPVLMWAALRFRLLGASVATLIVSCASVWATVRGRGAFAAGTFSENLLQLQIFMGVFALTGLILGAVAAERERAIHLRDQFLSMASHELKTPLTPMKLQVHLLRRSLDRDLPQGVQQQLGSKFALFEKQLDRIARLVDEMLDVARVDTGQLLLHREPFELGALIRDTVDAFREELALSGCRVEIRAAASVHGRWDRLRVQQVISNLVTNAMKYGGGEPITLELRSDALRDVAILSVTDQGIGIPREHQEIIFEAFERGSFAPRVGGLGLGLYIVSKIVEAHGGTVRVSSALGAGSTFTVELPLNGEQRSA